MSEPNYSAIAKDTMLPRAPIPLRLDTSNLHGSILGGRQGCVHAWVVSCLVQTLPANSVPVVQLRCVCMWLALNLHLSLQLLWLTFTANLLQALFPSTVSRTWALAKSVLDLPPPRSWHRRARATRASKRTIASKPARTGDGLRALCCAATRMPPVASLHPLKAAFARPSPPSSSIRS